MSTNNELGGDGKNSDIGSLWQEILSTIGSIPQGADIQLKMNPLLSDLNLLIEKILLNSLPKGDISNLYVEVLELWSNAAPYLNSQIIQV